MMKPDVAQGVARSAVVMVFSMFALSACAAQCLPQVHDGWIRLGPARMPMMAGFGKIENACDAPVTIVSASSPGFADVSMHVTRIVDGISRMRPLPEVMVPADGEAVFEPGGKHLMLMGPTRALQAGDGLEITFKLKDGRKISATFEVRKPGA